MRLTTIKQSQEIERLTQEVYGISGELLMESAGTLASRELIQSYFPELKKGTAYIICGPGNNGGDGLVLARHLHSASYRNIVVMTLSRPEKSSELFKTQLKRAELSRIKIISLLEQPEKMEQLKSASIIVDALFGIGLSAGLEESYLKAVDMMNSVKVPVVSLDVPSGLDADQGVALNATVKASMTLSFGLAKPGFFVGDGPSAVGKLRVLSIGFPYECLRRVATTHFAFTDKLARRYLPSRGEKTNKSDHGHVLVLAGSPDMRGAGILSALSAYRMGAGYVTWASEGLNISELESAPELLCKNINDKDLLSKEYTAIVIGPGFGVNENTKDWIEKLKTLKTPVVLDADAITTCVDYNLFPLPDNWVVTPHAGELSRITGEDAHHIENNRYEAALEAVKITGGFVLFKGFRTLLANKNRVMVVLSGNSALAKAGTGDVLSGMIAALMAQDVEPLQAAATACYIHGRMADEWIRVGNDKQSLLASDLTNHLPQLMSRLRGGALV
ncbi:MAG: NAD(P)H-hydrate dehydratase [Bdellovibrionaceae bacterium]|nr:NAD(P)H-hydrate dehydratase [Pseudobdellovibrionaceae bacterium]